MGTKFRISRGAKKIIIATFVAIFSLFSTISGTFAWFVANRTSQVEIGEFSVVSSGACDMDSIKLIKFDYASTVIGSVTMVDYLSPENGRVSMYDYNYEDHSFGVQDGLEWKEVESMNIYDPVDRVIRKTTLRDLNCNAIYEVSFSTDDFISLDLQLTSTLFDRGLIDLDEGDICLSDCVDIDIFYESDLVVEEGTDYIIEDDDETPLINEYNDKAYYPSYKVSNYHKYCQWNGSNWIKTDSEPLSGTNRGTINYEDYLPETPTTNDYYLVLYQANNLTELEHIYYKLSYLSSLKVSHNHFYGNPKSNEITIEENKTINFSSGVPVKFYINVNYSPLKADEYINRISLSSIDAIFDYYYKFAFTGGVRA